MSAEHQSNHANALTGISQIGNDNSGKAVEQRLSTYAYDARGRAILSTKAGGIDKIEVDYKEAALPRQHKVGKGGKVLPAQFGIMLLTNGLG